MTSLEKLYEIGQFIDTSALGFSARVARATHWPTGEDVAFKVMRREHVGDDGVWGQFAVEAALLEVLRPLGTMNAMVDCGFVSDLNEERPGAGKVVSCGCEFEDFRRQTAKRKRRGWRPYIALEYLAGEHCLLNLVRGVDGDYKRPLRLATEEGLALALQFTDFLSGAYARDVVYRDYKPEHVYWDGERLRLIDLNVSRVLGREATAAIKQVEKRVDLRRFVIGVLYTVFTGRDMRFQDRIPQAAPSAPNTVEKRFEQVDGLDFDEQAALLPELIDLMEKYGQHTDGDGLTVETMSDDLRRVAALAGWEVGFPVSEAARAARAEVQRGLATLREAQAKIEAAREYFLRAQTLNPEDPESERLYRAASEFYRHRLLP